MVVQYGGQQQRRCDAAKSGAPLFPCLRQIGGISVGAGGEKIIYHRGIAGHIIPLISAIAQYALALRAVVFQFIFPRHGGAAGFENFAVHKLPFASPRGLCAAAIIMRGQAFFQIRGPADIGF